MPKILLKVPIKIITTFRIWRNLTERILSGSFKFLDGELKQIADEKLFLELALRGYGLSEPQRRSSRSAADGQIELKGNV